MRLYILAQSLAVPTAYAASGAVVDAEGRILLARHRYKLGWQLPIGGVHRGEAGVEAIRRELKEEIGLLDGAVTLFGVYTRKSGWATNVIALYRITGATMAFKANFEVAEIRFVDPLNPPADCTDDTRRRLLELAGTAVPDPYW